MRVTGDNMMNTYVTVPYIATKDGINRTISECEAYDAFQDFTDFFLRPCMLHSYHRTSCVQNVLR